MNKARITVHEFVESLVGHHIQFRFLFLGHDSMSNASKPGTSEANSECAQLITLSFIKMKFTP